MHGTDASGKAVLKNRLRREQLTGFFGIVPGCILAMEATRGADYWARIIRTFEHQVRLITPQFVKPYLRGQKNDVQNAAAICETASRPEVRLSTEVDPAATYADVNGARLDSLLQVYLGLPEEKRRFLEAMAVFLEAENQRSSNES